MVHAETAKMIRKMSNEQLLYTHNKIRKEKENPEIYGKHGSSRWVTQSEFWGGHHAIIKDELKRRQHLGLIHKRAGKPKTRKESGLGFGLFR